jgi:3-hydroxyisobutyrate dehydrogenase-like beta-hydroxyacid dehydrogenase
MKGGHELVVNDIRRQAAEPHLAAGAKWAATPREVAEASEVVLTSLPGPVEVEAVAIGDHGILSGMSPGKAYFDLSTNSPTLIRRLHGIFAAKGVHLLDAPVSGGPRGAKTRKLALWVGGDQKIFDRFKPVLDAIGDKVMRVGEIGSGTIAKLVNNMIGLCYVAASAEALVLAKAAGMDVRKLDEVIRVSSGDSFAYRAFADRALSGNYKADFALELSYKDIHLALELADELRSPVPQLAQVHNLMRMALGLGYAKDDPTSIVRVYEQTQQLRLSD